MRMPHAAVFLGLVPLFADCDPSTLGNVILSGPDNSVSKTVGDNHTVSWDSELLYPTSYDAPGTKHTLEFKPGFDRQELVALDYDYGRHFRSWADHAPLPLLPIQVSFISIPERFGSKTYTLPYGTHTIIRYWHGKCAIAIKWEEIFNNISEQVFDKALSGARETKATWIKRKNDLFAPTFVGLLDDIHHGFCFDAEYSFGNAWGKESYYFNAAYSIHTRDSDGLVTVLNRQIHVNPWKQSIGDGLASLSGIMEKQIASKMTFPIPKAITTFECDPSAALELQQEACLEAMITSRDGVPSPASQMFQLPLLLAGFTLNDAMQITSKMLRHLERRHFTCKESMCAFHPIVRRVNVMPGILEFVLVRNEASYDEGALEEQVFYKYLPIVADFISPGASDQLPIKCDERIGSGDGGTIQISHGSLFKKFR